MKLHIGTSGFGYSTWKGKFYPEKLVPDEMLRFYSDQFSAVEINNTFFRMPKEADLKKWAAKVPREFVFAFKAPRQITHSRRLKDCADPVQNFFAVTTSLKRQLGPLLFQLPPTFKKDLSRLRDFMQLLPANGRIAFEFRHQSWFEADVFRLLREHGTALCIAEDDNDLQIPLEATTNWGYLRLRRLDYTLADLRGWAKQIAKQDWREAFVFFKHEDQAIGVGFAKQFQELCDSSKQA